MTDFITKTVNIKGLRKAVDAWLESKPGKLEVLPTREFMKASGTTEGRTWLVARRWVIEAAQPHLLVDVSALIKGKDADQVDPTIAKVVIKLRGWVLEDGKWLRKGDECSWGEIMVRTGLTEGRVRKLFSTFGPRKDRGLRIGKGGRFVTDNPTLYLNNMKSEGAEIKVDFKGIPATPEKCANYKKPRTARAPRRAAQAPAA